MAHLTKYEALEFLDGLTELVRKHGHEVFPEGPASAGKAQSAEKDTATKPTGGGGDGKLRGSPTKYKDEWAVRIDKKENPEPQVGDIVEVTSSGGKSWDAIVSEVLPDYPDNYLVRAPGKDKGRGGGGNKPQTSKSAPKQEPDPQALTDDDDVPF